MTRKSATRKSAFSTWVQNQQPAQESGEGQEAVSLPVLGDRTQLPPAPDVLSQLKTVTDEDLQAKPGRDRSWEKSHQGITYRGIPAPLRDAIKGIAVDYGYPADIVARAFLEYAVVCYERGDLQVNAILSRGRRTTLHTDGIAWEERNGEPPPLRKKPREPRPPWKEQVTYRLPDDLIGTVKAISDRLGVTRGDVAARFLTHALDAYQAGKLAIFENKPN